MAAIDPQSDPAPRLRRALLEPPPATSVLLVFYAAYMIAAGFGRWMMVIPDIPITIWPPSGVVLAMLLTHPTRTWGWWLGLGALGELTGNALWFHNPLPWALGYAVANAAAVLAAASLLAPRLSAPFRRFATLGQVLAFLVVGVLAAPVISATLGSAINAAAGKSPFTATWPIWWLGDATGILIATPLAISAARAWRAGDWPGPARLAEGLAIGAVMLGLSLWVLSNQAVYGFLLPVPILWAAVRFQFRGATLAVLVLTLAIGVHAQGFRDVPLPDADFAQLHAKLQVLILVAASTGLVVAAVIRQQRQALADLARINDELELRVAERTRAIEAAEQRFKATFENAGVGIGIVGGDGVLVRVNDRLARMLGHGVEELQGHRLEQFTHPADQAMGEEAWRRLSAGEADEYELEKRFVQRDGQVVWGHTTVSCVRDADGKISYLIKVIQDITERKRSESVQQMLMREVNHRSKNLLSIVQVIARQTSVRSPEDFIETFGERLQALAANQDLLVNNRWQRISLCDLVRDQLKHIAAPGGRVTVEGPPVLVPPSAAQTLGMALHELATNAAKYGSLSNDSGKVEVRWTVDEAAQEFRMSWQERGGPPVTKPKHTGFGTTVLDRLTASSLSGEVGIDFDPQGLGWRLRCPLSAFDSTAAEEEA